MRQILHTYQAEMLANIDMLKDITAQHDLVFEEHYEIARKDFQATNKTLAKAIFAEYLRLLKLYPGTRIAGSRDLETRVRETLVH